jgi:hypothetical protein
MNYHFIFFVESVDLIMKRILVSLLFFTLNSGMADDEVFKHQDVVIGVWDTYIDAVDNKNIEEMFSYFSLPVTLHFDNNAPIVIETEESFKDIFNVWKDSNKANFHHTERKSVTVTEIRKNFLCVADVVYERHNNENQLISRIRSLYHFVYKNENWKIYLITNVDLN